jgi:hypothetical protein
MGPIHHTYELYLDDGDGKPRFEALTCASRSDLLPTVRRIISEKNLRSVEVRELGVSLFTVGG